MRELPLPCNHAVSSWTWRISSHSDADIDAAGGISGITESFCSVWVCDRAECIADGKRYVAATALCRPVMQLGTRSETTS